MPSSKMTSNITLTIMTRRIMTFKLKIQQYDIQHYCMLHSATQHNRNKTSSIVTFRIKYYDIQPKVAHNYNTMTPTIMAPNKMALSIMKIGIMVV